ncbi:Uncharacterised protein [Vibrio cholerae]|nr:Uncharacterised protein [Vibrio cholerae]
MLGFIFDQSTFTQQFEQLVCHIQHFVISVSFGFRGKSHFLFSVALHHVLHDNSHG